MTLKIISVHTEGRWQKGTGKLRINEIPFQLRKDPWKHLKQARITVMPVDVLISTFLLGERHIKEPRNKASNLRNQMKFFSL